jgi:predicted ATP-binding protein involved in virulence
MIPPRFWLQCIELNNYRCFGRLSVDFDEQLTVLIARNGLGKTAVLDAISVAFGPFIGSFHTGKSTGILPADVRLRLTNSALREMEPQYPSSIKAKAKIDIDIEGITKPQDQQFVYVLNNSNPIITWEQHRNSSRSKALLASSLILRSSLMQKLVGDNQPIKLPLVAYYGTGRLWKQKTKPEKKVFKKEFFSRTAGYKDCLDPASSFKYVADWFDYATKADFEERNLQREKYGQDYAESDTAFTPLLAAVRLAVDECLKTTGWQGLRYSFKHQAVVMEHPQQGVLEVSQLSDGVRNMIGLVADIAYRTVRLNSQFGQQAPKQTPGLVLIDEVDMHLHPEWQHVVLQNLTAAFPHLQFVVTTHSPQVLSTVKREQIRLLTENVTGEAVAVPPEARTYGRSNADVLQTVMDVSPEPILPESQELKEYLNLVEKDDWRSDRVDTLRRHLVLTLGEDHPSLVRADMIVRRRKALER